MLAEHFCTFPGAGGVDEPDVLFPRAAAAPTVTGAEQFVVVVAAAITELGHPRQPHV